MAWFRVSVTTALTAVLLAPAFGQPCDPRDPNCDVPPAPTLYRIVDPGTFGSPGSATYANATGINEAGNVAGIAEDDQIQNHGFLYRDGQLIDIGALNPTGLGTNAKGVNDFDQIVGQSAAPYPPNPDATVGHPFLWTEGAGMIDLAAPGFETNSGWAWGINNLGQVALTHAGRPYFWDPNEGHREITLSECDGSCGGEAWEINNNGLVVGNLRNPDTFRFNAFKYDSQTDQLVVLHDPNLDRHSLAYGVNDLDDVVGWAELLSLRNVPVLWPKDTDAQIQLPLDLREDLLEGESEHINNLGDIVGKDRSITPGVNTEAWVIFDALRGGDLQKIALESLLSDADLPEWELTVGFEINDARQITGIGLHNDLTRAFLMTPVFPGDVDNDCDVDLDDLTLLLQNFGSSSARIDEGDMDGDGDVDLDDLTLVLQNFGAACS